MMSKGRELRCYDYVNHPYDLVRDALREDALAVFQAAIKNAASRAESIASELRVSIGGFEIAKEIAIKVNNVEEDASASSPKTVLRIAWEATESPRLFPLMNAELSIYPLTRTETQLDFAGLYKPPVGALGGAIDSIVGTGSPKYRCIDSWQTLPHTCGQVRRKNFLRDLIMAAPNGHWSLHIFSRPLRACLAR